MGRRISLVVSALMIIGAAAIAFSVPRRDARKAEPPSGKLPQIENYAAASGGSLRSLDEVVLAENFEAYGTGELPRGWAQADVDGGYCSWFDRASRWQVFERGGFAAHSGLRMAMCHYNDGALPNDDYLILPRQHLNGTITFSFWAASQDPIHPESFEVRVSTAGRNPADFTHLIAQHAAISAQWTFLSHDLSAFAGTPFYVALRYTSVDKFVLKIDDVTVDGTPMPSGWIAGTLRDTARQVVPEATLVLPLSGDTLRSDAAGQFTTGRLPVSSYIMIIGHEYHQPRFLPGLAVAAGETTWVEPELVPLRLAHRTYTSAASPRAISDFDTAAMPLFDIIFDTLAIFDFDVTVNIEHSYVGDLSVWLRSPEPDYIIVPLIAADPFNSGRNIQNCRFNDEAISAFGAGVAPYTGRFRPQQPLRSYDNRLTLGFAGNQVRRTWNLFAYDHSAGDQGRITGFTLHVAVSKGLVGGYVRRATNATPIAGVTISVQSGAARDSVVSNSAGLYFLPAPPGTQTIRFRYPNYYVRVEPDIEVDLAAVRFLDVALDSITLTVPEVPPAHFELFSNYPNPFNAETRIRFTLDRAAAVSMTVYSLTGREVRRLLDKTVSAGVHEIPFHAGDLPSGIYLARIQTGQKSQTIKMLLTR